MSPTRPFALLLALALPACTVKGDDAGATDTDATDTTSATQITTGETGTDATDATDASDTTDASPTDGTTGEAPVGCVCPEGDPCSVSLCPTAALESEGDTEGVFDDPELVAATTCALEALRDGKAGRIVWTSYINGGQFTTNGRIEMFGDGKARRSVGGAADLCISISDYVEVGPLEPAAFFDACLAETDQQMRFNCIGAALAETTVVCDYGEDDCSGI